MSKLLYIKANPKRDGFSRTFKVSDKIIEDYKINNPEDEIITLDLYKEEIKFITNEDLKLFSDKKTENSRYNSVLKYAYQFADADKIIIAAPLWNLSFPAILKAYLDYISVNGITFKYTENGPIGLCRNKKAIHIVSRGGHYMEGPSTGFEMGDRYLRVLFGFLGISDFQTLAIEGLDVIGADVDDIISKSIKKGKIIANEF